MLYMLRAYKVLQHFLTNFFQSSLLSKTFDTKNQKTMFSNKLEILNFIENKFYSNPTLHFIILNNIFLCDKLFFQSLFLSFVFNNYGRFTLEKFRFVFLFSTFCFQRQHYWHNRLEY